MKTTQRLGLARYAGIALKNSFVQTMITCLQWGITIKVGDLPPKRKCDNKHDCTQRKKESLFVSVKVNVFVFANNCLLLQKTFN